MLQPLANGIFFIFEDDTTSNKFVNTAKSGILLAAGQGDQSNIPRCGTVIMVGPDVEGVSPGEYILVEPGMWTQSFTSDGLRLWKTDDTKVLCVSEEPIPAY